MKRLVIWKVSAKDANMASFRYRCLMPFRWQNKIDENLRHVIAGNSEPIVITKDVAALIFVKTFSNYDLKLAKKAHALNIPVFIDLCDNIMFRVKQNLYADANEKALLESSYRNFHAMVGFCTAITTTGRDLADEIRREFPGVRIHIISDSIDSPEDRTFINQFSKDPSQFGFSKKDLGIQILKNFHNFIFKAEAYRFLFRIVYYKTQHAIRKRKTKTKPDSELSSPLKSFASEGFKTSGNLKKILWFGNSGIPGLYGMTDILLIQEELVSLYAHEPFVLMICSNNRDVFDQYIAPLPISTLYFKWSLEKNLELLQNSNVVIIPNPENPFTTGKSANRALLALEHQRPVVATKTSALEPLQELVLFENWRSNIEEVFRSPGIFHQKWKQHWKELSEHFSSRNAARRWQEIVKSETNLGSRSP